MKPGASTIPAASTTTSPARGSRSPTSTIRSPRILTAPSNAGPPLPSTIRALAMTVLSAGAGRSPLQAAIRESEEDEQSGTKHGDPPSPEHAAMILGAACPDGETHRHVRAGRAASPTSLRRPPPCPPAPSSTPARAHAGTRLCRPASIREVTIRPRPWLHSYTLALVSCT